MGNGYKYDAFISYRHAELDKFVAENLHKRLESYKISKKVLSNGKARRSKIERVFRDKDELPITNNLEDPIIQALQNSEYLIVICTPRLKESVWCKKEIETFISMHGRDKILAVLAEGEPHESFPEEILYRDEEVTHPDGTVSTRLVPAEPLAADVRGKNKKEVLKAMDVEVLRLLAPMLGVDFDDLRQRHRERKFKKIITATVAAAVLCLGIGVASTITALHINKQKEQIEAQSIEIQAQADEIASQSDAIQAQNQQLQYYQAENLTDAAMDYLEEGNREKAVETALAAVTEYEGIPMPYTPGAQYALTESLYMYDAGSKIKPMYQIVMPSQVEQYILSPDKEQVLCWDSIGNIGIWHLSTGQKKIWISQETGNVSQNYNPVDFLTDRLIVYITDDNALIVYDIEDDEEMCRTNLEYGGNVLANNNYIVIYDYSYIFVLKSNGDSIEEISSIQPSEGYTFSNDVYMSDQGKLCYVERKDEDIDALLDDNKDMTGYCQIYIYDLYNKADDSVIPVNYDGVNTIVFDENYMYYAMSNYQLNSEDGLVKYDMSNNEVVWEVPMEAFVTDVCLPGENGDALLAVGTLEAFLVDESTGEQLSRIDSANSIVNARPVGENSFELFTQNSDYGQYHVEYDTYIMYADYFVKSTDSVIACEKTEGGYLLQGLNDNKLTYYEVSMGSDIILYEREFNSEGIGRIADYGDDIAEDMNPAKANLACTELYNDDNSVVFISYTDKTVEIYNTKTKELLATLTDVEDDISTYYGTDDEGRIYIGGYSYGYILDKDYNLLARPEMLRGVDFDAGLIIVEVGDEYGCFPVYTLDELIFEGEVYLSKMSKK